MARGRSPCLRQADPGNLKRIYPLYTNGGKRSLFFTRDWTRMQRNAGSSLLLITMWVFFKWFFYVSLNTWAILVIILWFWIFQIRRLVHPIPNYVLSISVFPCSCQLRKGFESPRKFHHIQMAQATKKIQRIPNHTHLDGTWLWAFCDER